jgi:phospholipase/carboxylesterase
MLAGLLVLCACKSKEKQPAKPHASPLPKATANTAQPDVGFVDNARSGLRTLEVRSGSRSLILLHGYGSSPEDWVQFTETIRVPNDTRFVFPEAPELTVPPDGPAGGRGWWRIDWASYINHGKTLLNFSGSRPEGIDSANEKIRALIGDVETRPGTSEGPPILGGFSQGAMLAADVAFTTDQPLKALIILSGTFVDEAGWTKGMAQRKGLPVFISHGQKDDILQYRIAIRLRDAMKHAGLQVHWVPFAGGHEVPAEVVTALNTFLAHLD